MSLERVHPLREDDPRWRRTAYGKTRTTLYLDEKLWKEFKTICAREGHKMSNKIERWINEYVKEHNPGNPQQVLERFNKSKPYIAPKKCHIQQCPNPAVKVMEFRGQLFACCSEHAKAHDRNSYEWRLRSDLEVSR